MIRLSGSSQLLHRLQGLGDHAVLLEARTIALVIKLKPPRLCFTLNRAGRRPLLLDELTRNRLLGGAPTRMMGFCFKHSVSRTMARPAVKQVLRTLGFSPRILGEVFLKDGSRPNADQLLSRYGPGLTVGHTQLHVAVYRPPRRAGEIFFLAGPRAHPLTLTSMRVETHKRGNGHDKALMWDCASDSLILWIPNFVNSNNLDESFSGEISAARATFQNMGLSPEIIDTAFQEEIGAP